MRQIFNSIQSQQPTAALMTDRLHQTIWKLVDFRGPRLVRFKTALEISEHSTLLDVGGTASAWSHPEAPKVAPILLNLPAQPRGSLRMVRADGTALPFQDNAFAVLFSNSVIEHVGTWERQVAFAAEARRVGRALWVQTPAKVFPLEPHWIGIGVQWLPSWIQRRVVRWLTLYGLATRPGQDAIDRMIDEIRLLSFAEMQQLFPDCEIWVERWCGLPKSYVAIRKPLRSTVDHG